VNTTLKMGVGLLPREKEPRRVRLGHMWLYWTVTETDHHPPMYYNIKENLR